MWIMVAGPYRTGALDEEERARNLRALNLAAHAIHERGHVPIVGVNLALPIIEAGGASSYDEIMLPLCLALAERCDAILRLAGASPGADLEVERVRARGGVVYASVGEIPRASGAS